MIDLEAMIKQRDGLCSTLSSLIKEIRDAVELIATAFANGRRLFICGNGGSAADSQHMAAEFIGRFGSERRGLPALALTTDSSALTAIANDWSYEYVFRRQLEALGQAGDIVIGISTSGTSKNVLEALVYARTAGLMTIGLVGHNGGKMIDLCDILINVNSNLTPIIQERHLAIEHMICEGVEHVLRSIDAL
jgi:D-sedoheptulose 7-phosphate isomerase